MSDASPPPPLVPELRGELAACETAPLPTMSDAVVVGAGAAGLATALRLTELGRSVVLLDRDDLLAVARAWDHHGQRMYATVTEQDASWSFPRGGELLQRLAFEHEEAAVEVCARWSAACVEAEIPLRSGVELLAVEEATEGLRVRARRGAQELELTTRNVVLAVGCGAARRPEMAGELGALPESVGSGERVARGPVCVLGSGAKAAEAVLEIAAIKARSGDGSPLVWSFRTHERPALYDERDERLAELLQSGRVEALPRSRAIAVVDEAAGRRLVVRAGEPAVAGELSRGTVLEFDLQHVLSFVGHEDEDLLERLGIPELEVGDQDFEGVAVTPWYESCRPGIFLVGDVLSPSFVQTRRFDTLASDLAVREHRGCFKLSLRDGALAAEAIAARVQGLDDDAVAAHVLAVEESWQQEGAAVPGVPLDRRPAPVDSDAVALLMRLDDEGHEQGALRIPGGASAIDHSSGAMREGAARIGETGLVVDDDGCRVHDPGGCAETLIRLAIERTLLPAQRFYAGGQTLQVVDAGAGPVLAVMGSDSQVRKVLAIPAGGADYGRTATASVIGIDGSDAALSRRHFRLQGSGKTYTVRDWGGVNGTYVDVGEGEVKLLRGEILWVGPHAFRYDGLEGSAPAEAATRVAATAVGGTLRIDPQGAERPVDPSRTLLQLVGEAGLATESSTDAKERTALLHRCSGPPSCYLCVVRVVAGAEHLSPIGAQEQRGLQFKLRAMAEEGVAVNADGCRLACQARATGPVQIELLGDTDV